MGIATAEREAPLVGKGPVEVTENCHRFVLAFNHLLVGIVVLWRDGVVECEHPAPLSQVVARVEVIAADNVIEGRTDLPRRTQLLAPLAVILLAQHVVEVGGRRIEILCLRFGRLAITGYRGQLHPAKVQVHFQRSRWRAIVGCALVIEDRVKISGVVAIALVGGFEQAKHFAGPRDIAVDHVKNLVLFFHCEQQIEVAVPGLEQQ